MSMNLLAKVSAAYILAVALSAAGHAVFQGSPLQYAGQLPTSGMMTASVQQ